MKQQIELEENNTDVKMIKKKSTQLNRTTLEQRYLYMINKLNNLVKSYKRQREYEKIESVYLQILKLRIQFLGENQIDVADSLSNLGKLYYVQERYEEAESFLIQSLQLHKQILGESHPDIVNSLNNLAKLYYGGRYKDTYHCLLFLNSLIICSKSVLEDFDEVALHVGLGNFRF